MSWQWALAVWTFLSITLAVVAYRFLDPHAMDPDTRFEERQRRMEESRLELEKARRDVYSNPEAERLWKLRNEMSTGTGAIPS